MPLDLVLAAFLIALLALPKFNALVSGAFQHWVVGTIKHVLKIGP